MDKIVNILFNADEKLDRFYKLLKDNNILSETEEPKSLDADGSLQEIELRYAFRKNQHYFTSFILRSALQILLSAAVLYYLTTNALKHVVEDTNVHCNVHGYWHECHGIPMSIKHIT